MTSCRGLVAFRCVSAFIVPASGVTAPPPADSSEFVPGQIVVKLKAAPGKAPNQVGAGALAARFGQASVRSLLPEALAARRRHGSPGAGYVLDYGKNTDVRGLAKQIAADPAVAYAEPN